MALNDKITHGQGHRTVNAKHAFEEPQDTTRTHHHLEIENEMRAQRGKPPMAFRHGPSTSTPEYHIKESQE